MVCAERAAEGQFGLGAAISGEAVGLGGDDEVRAVDVAEEFGELDVAGLRGDVGVDEAEAEGERGAFGEVWLDEFGPPGGDGSGDFGVAVAGKVGKEEIWLLSFGRGGEAEEVDGACAARCRGDFGLGRAEECIEEAGFADVGAAEEGELGRGGRRKVVRGGGRAEKFGEELHAVLSIGICG